jgi:hypothetical protein
MSEKTSDDDLKKALAFLLEKEMKEYSLEKKKEFLLKKVSPEIVDKALSLYPLIENNIEKNFEEFKKDNSKGFLDSFFDFGVISTVLLATLGINYLIDLNRNKKSDLFYKEIEKKIKDELSKNAQEMKNEIQNELKGFVKRDELADDIKDHIDTYNKQKGLSLNLSSKSIKENVTTMKGDITGLEKKIKEMGVKMENNNLIFRQEMLKELNDIIVENNKNLLLQIIENQNKLLLNANINTGNNNNNNFSPLVNKIINDEVPSNNITNDYKTDTILNLKVDSEEENKEQIASEEEVKDFKAALDEMVKGITNESDVKKFVKSLEV